MAEPTSLVEVLAAARFVRLTTTKRDGTDVATPVWVVRDGAVLLVWTGPQTGKVKRIRHTPAVSLVACTASGTPLDVEVTTGTARLLGPEALPRIRALLARKYRLGYPAVRVFNRLRHPLRGPGPSQVIEITVHEPAA